MEMTLCVMMNRTTVAHRKKPAVLSAPGGGRVEGYLVALAAGHPRLRRVPHTLRALVDVHHGPGTERREIAAPGFDAKLLQPCPLVLHILLGYSRRDRCSAKRCRHRGKFRSGCAPAVRLFGRAPRDAGGENVAFKGSGSRRMLIAKEGTQCLLTD